VHQYMPAATYYTPAATQSTSAVPQFPAAIYPGDCTSQSTTANHRGNCALPSAAAYHTDDWTCESTAARMFKSVKACKVGSTVTRASESITIIHETPPQGQGNLTKSGPAHPSTGYAIHWVRLCHARALPWGLWCTG